MYKNDVPQTPGVYINLFADIWLYATDRKEGFVLRNLQRRLSSMVTWCEQWSIKISKEKIQAVYFSLVDLDHLSVIVY
jgi:hypothetical protein